MSSENVCKLKTAGETSSKLINYFCNVDVNVSVIQQCPLPQKETTPRVLEVLEVEVHWDTEYHLVI